MKKNIVILLFVVIFFCCVMLFLLNQQGKKDITTSPVIYPTAVLPSNNHVDLKDVAYTTYIYSKNGKTYTLRVPDSLGITASDILRTLVATSSTKPDVLP